MKRPRSLSCCTEPSTHCFRASCKGNLNATLRHRANATIITQLDATSVAELRRRGAAMTEDEATAYALDAIGRAI